MLTFFIGDLLPIIVIMLLGYFSGRRETFSEDQARAFNKLVLNYALPAALFVSITRANREMIFCGHSSDPCITCGLLSDVSFSPGSVATNFLNVPMQKQLYVH
ncbi:transporter YfdV [Escherichia coli]|uniref:Transporter YfdV n=1 Tax=Escherichia coli TaxID=562 RepID=A0A376KQR5_ECOLX|nr:transporter YfdV [Escherichia coli]